MNNLITMKNFNEQYFYVKRDGNPKFPLVEYAKGENNLMFMCEKFVNHPAPIKLECMKPLPGKFIMGDYHSLGYPEAVVSKRMKETLESFNLRDVQFAPALINTKGNEIVSDYCIFHVYNQIRCADLEKSEWEASDDEDNPNRVYSFDKLVLDNESLDKIPLEERLVFAVEELETEVLYHESVVEKLLEAELTGFTIYRLSNWDPSAPFEDEYFAPLIGK
jgi:hypothetical protein